MLNDEPERRGQGAEEEAKAGLGGSWLRGLPVVQPEWRTQEIYCGDEVAGEIGSAEDGAGLCERAGR